MPSCYGTLCNHKSGCSSKPRTLGKNNSSIRPTLYLPEHYPLTSPSCLNEPLDNCSKIQASYHFCLNVIEPFLEFFLPQFLFSMHQSCPNRTRECLFLNMSLRCLGLCAWLSSSFWCPCLAYSLRPCTNEECSVEVPLILLPHIHLLCDPGVTA